MRGGGGKGLSTKEKITLEKCFYFKFVTVLLTTKGGGAKGLSGLSIKKRFFLRLP